jgi:hypothetical protein
MSDLLNKRFGRLLAISSNGRDKHYKKRWLCKCDCGNTVTVLRGNLLKGTTRSCGCLRSELLTANKTKHGFSTNATHKIWYEMIRRCFDKKSIGYKNYGGRGITVCEHWLTFENFLADMGERPLKLSIDRKNNNGNYEPNNCRWATGIEQHNNRRNNRILTHNGRSLTLTEWSRELEICQTTLSQRIRYGWPIERVLTAAVEINKRKKLTT